MSAASLLRKVELLEEWAVVGKAPDGAWVPETPGDLRRWENRDLGLTSWTSRNLAAPKGPYPDLRARFDVAVARLLHNRASRSQSVRSRAPEIARLKLEVKSLAEQVVCLHEDLAEIQHLLSLERERRIASEKREAELLRQTRTLHVVSRKPK